METNDFWTHVGLVTVFFLVIVAPTLFSPGHAVNSVVYIAGGVVVIVTATVLRRRTKAQVSRTESTQS